MKLTMNLTMKLTMKTFLVIILFCSTTLADGDINNGHGDGSGGGFACVECVIDDQEITTNEKEETNANDSILKSIKIFLSNLLG